MARDFYPFVEKDEGAAAAGGTGAAADDSAFSGLEVNHPARIAVYDDASAAPRVVVVEPKDVRDYLEEITATVNRLSHEQGGTIPFMVIREIVENFIHAYFQAPTITILDGGNTIRFSDQGPGIKEKSLALEYGTSSATEEMKHYIRGVGSGLPYAQQYMEDKGGSLEIEDNIAGGTVVTISTRGEAEARAVSKHASGEKDPGAVGGWQAPAAPAPQGWPYGTPTGGYATPGGYPQQQAWGWQQPQSVPAPQGAQQPWQQQAPYPQQQPAAAQPYPQQPAGWPQGGGAAQQPAWPQQPAQPQVTAPVPQPAAADGSFSPQAEPAGRPDVLPQVSLDERSRRALALVAERGQVGPTDLTQAYGSSGPTWSRVLSNLAAQGLVIKSGQKYQLTAVGRAFV